VDPSWRGSGSSPHSPRAGERCAAWRGLRRLHRALIGLWIAVGQPLAGSRDVGPAARSRIVAGYSEAMAYEDPARAWEYGAGGRPCGPARVAIARGADRSDALRFAARVAVVAALGFAFFKAAFVRHDGHGTFFFLYLLLAPLWIEWRPRAAAVAGICCAAAGGILLATGNIPRDTCSIRGSGSNTRRGLRALRRRDLRPGRQRKARAAMRAQFPLEPALLAALATSPSTSIRTARRWCGPTDCGGNRCRSSRPTARIPRISRDRADEMADRARAALILHELTPAIDGRHPLWEAPRYTLERLCRYREEMRSGAWQCCAADRVAAAGAAAARGDA